MDYQHFHYVFKNILKITLNNDIEYDPSGNSNLSFHVGADILNLLLFYELLCFSMYSKYYDLIKQHFFDFFLDLIYK